MVEYELPGEPLVDVFPANVERRVFHGVDVLRIIGARSQVTATTAMLEELYPHDEKVTLGDAQLVGYARGAGGMKSVPMWELIVLRKVKGCE